MTGAASTTVCARQASMGMTVSARLDPVNRQGECWPGGEWEVRRMPGDGGEKQQDCRESGGEVLGLRVRSPTWGT